MRNNKNNEITHSSYDIKQCLKKAFPTLKSLYNKECINFYHCRQCIRIGHFITKITKRKIGKRVCGQDLSDLIREIYWYIIGRIDAEERDPHCWCAFKKGMVD